MQVKDPSLLRFLVDMRGEDVTNKQLRDDLMTMLIAGHETTAAVLTWSLFSIMQLPDVEGKVGPWTSPPSRPLSTPFLPPSPCLSLQYSCNPPLVAAAVPA